jgi:uridylate kinase
MFDTLTPAEFDELRAMLHRGVNDSAKLTIFASYNCEREAYNRVNGTFQEMCYLHELVLMSAGTITPFFTTPEMTKVYFPN